MYKFVQTQFLLTVTFFKFDKLFFLNLYVKYILFFELFMVRPICVIKTKLIT